MRCAVGAVFGAAWVRLAFAAPEASSQHPLGHDDGGASEHALPFSTSDLEKFIEGTMEKWHAPGMAVSVINGNATWAKVSLYT